MKPIGLLLVLVMLSAAGCSTFNYEWRREARHPVPTNDITGAWEGKWLSTVNGHHDALRCLVARDSQGQYQARFRAAYRKFLHFSYTVPLDVKAGTNGVNFHGSADLGILAGGIYQYDGRATPTEFFSTYDSKYDRGTFEMTRPRP